MEPSIDFPKSDRGIWFFPTVVFLMSAFAAALIVCSFEQWGVIANLCFWLVLYLPFPETEKPWQAIPLGILAGTCIPALIWTIAQ
ncbi:hypothetical protein MAUB1S_07476 [Mycolicibacterium aubagnense]